MSTREPMWYCHECHAEMRPLMVPDPHCASCNGTFVEKIENPSDDPRAYAHFGGGPVGEDAYPGEMDAFLAGLRNLLGGDRTPPASPPMRSRSPTPFPFPDFPNRSDRPSNSAFTIRIQNGGAPGMRTVVIGGGGPRGERDGIPSLSEFNGNARGQNVITGPLMAQYLLAMLSHRPGRPDGMGDPFSDLMSSFGLFGGGEGEPTENGRWGDYVFNQEALDQIISQIMENNNAHAPVPATEEVTAKLPREVLEEGSPLLEKDCAVCKEQFRLGTEDPDEQIVVTLPCKHPFHEPCILPWLKSSGTCPVCRFQLVPQPDHGAPGPGPPRDSGSNDPGRRPDGPHRRTSTNDPSTHAGGASASGSGDRSSGSPPNPANTRRARSPPRTPHAGAGLFNFFNFGGGHRRDGSGSGHRRGSSGGGEDGGDVPGSWGDSVD